MYDFRIIFKKSIRIYIYVALISVLISLILGQGKVRFIDILGNLSIFEAAIFFMIGGLKTVFRSPSMSGFRTFLKVSKEKWTIDDLKDAEESGLVYIVVALAFMFETLFLAFIF